MSSGIGGVGGYSPAMYGSAATQDPATQARKLQKEFDTLLENTQLRMRVDTEAGRLVVQVIDAASGEVLRQIPREEALRLAREMARQCTGKG